MIIGRLRGFCNRTFQLEHWEAMARDTRKRPQVAASVIMRAVMEMVFFGQKSLLALDQFARTHAARRWHGSRRGLVVSDTTLQRSLAGTDLGGLRRALRHCWKVLERQGKLGARLPSGRRMRVGILDSSDFGGHDGCVFALSGLVDAPVDVQMHPRGNELAAAEMLLARLSRTMGRGAADIVVADALYMSASHIRQCAEQLGVHPLLKTREENLAIIQDARGLFEMQAEGSDGIERLEGIDRPRGTRYRIKAAGGFRWQGMPYEFKVAWVREERLKAGSDQDSRQDFWVITTDGTLSARDMRELAHRRWRIENNVFKRLNALVGSKRCQTHDGHVKESLLLIWFLGLLMLDCWLASGEARAACGSVIGAANWAAVKQTCTFITRMLCDSLCALRAAAG